MPRQILRACLAAAAIALIISCALGMYFWQKEGMRLISIHSDNLSPALGTGDLIAVKGVAGLSTPLSVGQIEPNIVLRLPAGGYIYDFMRRPAALILLIYLPALLIALTQIKRLAQAHGYRPYHSASLSPRRHP